METDAPRDMLDDYLERVRSGGSAYPSDWSRVVTLSSRKSPHEIDRAAFRSFQAALLEATGLEAVVVGAKFGCTDLFIELSLPDPQRPGANVGIRTNLPSASSADLKAMFIAALQHDANLRALASAAGLSIVDAGVRLDLDSGKVCQSVPQTVRFNIKGSEAKADSSTSIDATNKSSRQSGRAAKTLESTDDDRPSR